MSSWKRDIASGLIIIVPIVVTLWVVRWLFLQIASVPFLQNIDAEYRVPLTILVFALLVLAVGYLMRTALGTLVEETLDNLINRIPILRVVYNASKLAVETALSGTEDMQQPVKLETWNGVRMTAFKTGRKAPDGREMLFLPTAPNITSGFVIEVEEDRIIEVDETVEDALTRVISAGFGESNDRQKAGVPIDVIEERGDQEEETPAAGDD